MKTCPQCGQQWGVKFRFCPQDGAELPEVVATTPAPPPKDEPKVIVAKPKTNQRLVNVKPVTAMPTNPAQPAYKDKPFAMPEPQTPQRTRRTGNTGRVRRAEGSITEAPREGGEPAWEVEHRATSKADSLARVAPTIVLDALTPEQVEADRKARGGQRKTGKSGPVRGGAAAARASGAAQAADTQPIEPRPKRARSEFSETAWFAQAPNADEADLETGAVAADPSKYTRESVAPDKRKRFSLRREGEE